MSEKIDCQIIAEKLILNGTKDICISDSMGKNIGIRKGRDMNALASFWKTAAEELVGLSIEDLHQVTLLVESASMKADEGIIKNGGRFNCEAGANKKTCNLLTNIICYDILNRLTLNEEEDEKILEGFSNDILRGIKTCITNQIANSKFLKIEKDEKYYNELLQIVTDFRIARANKALQSI